MGQHHQLILEQVRKAKNKGLKYQQFNSFGKTTSILKVTVIIPARYNSTRFPGKPLVSIHGKPMIQRVYEQVQQVQQVSSVVVATDDHRIVACVQNFGGKVCLTNQAHPSGTDRVYEAYCQQDPADLVINVQGDEPYIQPDQIKELIAIFNSSNAEIGTLIKQITSHEELFNVNKVKVVTDSIGKALYFSRQAIPFQKSVPSENWLDNQKYYKHIGIYAFRPSVLEKIVKLPVSALERSESLEQLRWLESGYSIFTAETKFEAHAIDTPEDLALLLQQDR